MKYYTLNSYTIENYALCVLQRRYSKNRAMRRIGSAYYFYYNKFHRAKNIQKLRGIALNDRQIVAR